MRLEWNPGTANPKQLAFFQSRALYTAYGGAKGGGKTWAVRTKAIGGAFRYPGIRILVMRRTYPELEENHIRPTLKALPKGAARYNGTSHLLTFYNGSTIKFGHWAGEQSEQEYQGLEFDWIFLDEATQFTERTFHYLGGCLRGVSGVPKRMYLTCNPGGVGHRWVKRLFIDRDFHKNPDNPEENERPDDYVFIPATVEDNPFLLKHSPGYLRMLANMPENLRAGYRYGDWNAMSGNYFPELRDDLHVAHNLQIPPGWVRYRAIDYGLDMLACLWIASDEQGRAWVYREFCKEGLIVRDAARAILERTLPEEKITATFAPPDLWSRQKDSGRTMAEVFWENGLPLTKADNSRVQGHMLLKDALALRKDGRPGLLISDQCVRLLHDLRDIQADPDNPDDCAKQPHDVTHSVDALRYFCVSRRFAAAETDTDEPGEEGETSFETFMTGGEPPEEYLEFT